MALISPPAANRAHTVRLYTAIVWLLECAACAYLSDRIGHPRPMVIWGLVGTIWFSLQMIIATSERDEWGPRVARTIPRSAPRRALAFLFYSGAGGGLLFGALGCLASIAGMVIAIRAYLSIDIEREQPVELASLIAAYTYCYCLSGILVRRLLAKSHFRIGFTWLLSGILFGLGSAIPFILAFAIFEHHHRASDERPMPTRTWCSWPAMRQRPTATKHGWCDFVIEPEAEAFTGPFVLDRAHPLLDGVSLAGVIWGGGTSPLPGQPVVVAGNVPLITDSVSSAGRHEVRVRLRHDISSLTESPAWPVLVWNLVHWRAAHLPGLDRANIRLDEEVLWSLGGKGDQATVKRPDGAAVVLPVRDRQVAIRAEQPGIHLLQADFETTQFAANPLNRDESDLARAYTGRWGDDRDETSLRLDYRDARWPLAILAAAAATLHLWFASRRHSGNRP